MSGTELPIGVGRAECFNEIRPVVQFILAGSGSFFEASNKIALVALPSVARDKFLLLSKYLAF
ncbi:hypothetical protein [Jonesia quinghaiensis]|uniref:hypothetical protein n=1 Tax=Jonesia quinghaiensis TaxID=262806 RepID=UPI0012FA95C5|nr:hypothetical protein [Jonesia quinghaiensis]